MSKSSFVLGIDYGTESGRVMLVDVSDGQEVAWCAVPYSNGVLDRKLPNGLELEPNFALQDPLDYLTVLFQGIPKVLKSAGVDGVRVAGIGIDFTSCTLLPSKADGTPLRSIPLFASNPHAWVKLWKHHAAQPQATRINDLANERQEEFMQLYGGGYSSEWFFSKVLETLEKAPEIYEAADRFLEAGDWLVGQLVGKESRSACTAGYKGMWIKGKGWPSEDFFHSLNPRLKNVIDDKVEGPLISAGEKAGVLTAKMADLTGLKAGTPVAASVIDAHAAVPACSLTQSGRLVMVMGTSLCHMLLGDEKITVKGSCGVVEDGIIPGFWGYEAGQAAVGDIYAWFFENGLSSATEKHTRKVNLTPDSLLTKKAAALKPGETGLLALDWWNGNRSVLMNADLSGVLLGMTLATRPEEIYRGLVESTAFGTRHIIETFERQGVPIRDIVACGGLAEKSPFVMQIFADVTGRNIFLPRSFQASGLGAAIHGAVAAGCYKDFPSAISSMASLQDEYYKPNTDTETVYDRLFAEYVTLHDYFGHNTNRTMKLLRDLRKSSKT